MSKTNSILENSSIDLAIGSVVLDLRENLNLTARKLSVQSNDSVAMISRIENGQASSSIDTLSGLRKALNVPVVSVFRETSSSHVDFTHVKEGEGLRLTRMVDTHRHDLINLAFHARRDLQLEAQQVTLVRQTARQPVL